MSDLRKVNDNQNEHERAHIIRQCRVHTCGYLQPGRGDGSDTHRCTIKSFVKKVKNTGKFRLTLQLTGKLGTCMPVIMALSSAEGKLY